MGLFCENVRGRQNDYTRGRVGKWAGVKEWEGMAATCKNKGKGQRAQGKEGKAGGKAGKACRNRTNGSYPQAE